MKNDARFDQRFLKQKYGIMRKFQRINSLEIFFFLCAAELTLMVRH
ncbi:MAG: hypothetical protein ACJA0C_000739 [Candidatus Endobugula sp.]|jgi:hypothetical protein